MIYRQIILAGAIVTGLAVSSAEAQERWQGRYGGLGVSAHELRTSIPGSSVHRFKEEGGGLSFYGGYNYVRDNGFVWGPDMVLSFIDSPGAASDAAVGATTFEGSFLFNPRVRLGFATQKVFFYGHLGLGVSDLGIDGSDSGTTITVRPAAGIGMEYATSELWALRVEATSFTFDSDDRRINGVDRDLDGSAHQVTLGLTRSF